MTDPRISAAAELHHGVVNRALLRDLHVDSETIHRLWDSPEWDGVTDQVVRRRGSPRTLGQQLAIAVLDSGPAARLSHLSAARWWGLRGCPSHPVSVVRVGATRRPTALARVHRVRRLPEDWVTELDGVPVVRPELCALQLFAVCRPERAERLVDQLWSDRLLSGPSLRRFLSDMGRRGRNGTAGVRQYLDRRPDDYVPPASGVETRAIRVLEGAGIVVRRQVDLGDESNWTGRVDLLVEGRRVVIEIQSERHHCALTDQEADRRRIALLEAAGFVVVEVTDVEVWTRPDVVVARVRQAIAAATPLDS